jgi:hypothetical protein
MADVFRHVTSESWFGRIGKSFGGILVGLVLLVVGPILLFWNEGRAVRTAQGLAEASGAVVSVSAEKVDAANDQKLVHLSGRAVTEEMLSDSEFGVSLNAIRLRRKVEMYQWKEHKRTESRDKFGGGRETETIYEYRKEWCDDPVDSTKFMHREGHQNPSWTIHEKEFSAQRVTVGSFVLPPEMVQEIRPYAEVSLQGRSPPENLRDRAKLAGDRWYLGADPANPAVGDVRIGFEAVLPCEISVMARQKGGSFEPYPTRSGTAISLVYPGAVTAAAMIKKEEETNTMITWLLRGLGFVLLWIGISSFFAPLVAIADFIPMLGGALQAGVALFGFLAAACVTLVTVSVAWIAYRPLLAYSLIGVAALALILALARRRPKSA